MSGRSILEDQYSVKCKACGVEFVDPEKWPSQKWLRGRCPSCGHRHPTKGPARGEFQARCMHPEIHSENRKGGDQKCQPGTR
jgi:DNA-directed RNA polymerase subunit RPC12/RpoP